MGIFFFIFIFARTDTRHQTRSAGAFHKVPAGKGQSGLGFAPVLFHPIHLTPLKRHLFIGTPVTETAIVPFTSPVCPANVPSLCIKAEIPQTSSSERERRREEKESGTDKWLLYLQGTYSRCVSLHEGIGGHRVPRGISVIEDSRPKSS